MFYLSEIPLTRTQRNVLYLLLVIIRWETCPHEKSYWRSGVDGYYCPWCGRTGYSGSDYYDPLFRSS